MKSTLCQWKEYDLGIHIYSLFMTHRKSYIYGFQTAILFKFCSQFIFWRSFGNLSNEQSGWTYCNEKIVTFCCRKYCKIHKAVWRSKYINERQSINTWCSYFQLPLLINQMFIKTWQCNSRSYILDKHWSFIAGSPFFLLSRSFSLCLSLSRSLDLKHIYNIIFTLITWSLYFYQL